MTVEVLFTQLKKNIANGGIICSTGGGVWKHVFLSRPLRGMSKKTAVGRFDSKNHLFPWELLRHPSEKSLQLAECFLHLLPKVTFKNQMMSQFKLKQSLPTIRVISFPMIYAGLNLCENGTMHTPGLHTHKVTYEQATGENALAEKGLFWNIS